eukprot:UN31195
MVDEWWKPSKMELPKQIFKNLTCNDPANKPCKNDSAMWQYNMYGMGIGGPCVLWSPSESFWCANTSAGGWAFMDNRMATDGQRQLPIGMTYGSDPKLDKFADWKNVAEGPGILHGWMDQTWFTNMWEIIDQDKEKNSLTFGVGGFQGGRNWHTNDTGFLIAGGWYVENIFEELDAPGEWYHNKGENKLYIYPNTTENNPLAYLNKITFIGSQLQSLFQIVSEDSKTPVKNIKIMGLNFRDTAYTYMGDENRGWGVPSGGDWSIFPNGAIYLENTEFVNITNCLFKRLDGNGIFLYGYNRNATIHRNEFAWMGDNAMAGWGITKENDGRNGEQPRFTLIEENYVHELGLFEKQSSLWFQAKTCQTTLRNNIFFNGPRAAINFNDGFGGGNIVEGNLIFNTCRESGDHGPINS